MSRALTQHGLKAAVKTDACSTLVSLNIFAGTEHDSANYGKVQESFRKHTAETANKGRAPPKKGGEKYSREYENANVNLDIITLANAVKSGEYDSNSFIELGTITKPIAQKIAKVIGIDFTGYKLKLEARQVRHIFAGHGENGTADHSMSNVRNLAKMQFAIEEATNVSYAGKTNAYTVYENGKSRPADTVIYEKDIGSKSYYVVQTAVDTKKKTLYIVTAFIGEKGYKNGDTLSFDDKIPEATPKSATASSPNTNISNTSKNVNEKFSREVKNAEEYFGTTYKVKEAGYICTDGKMLNFSGRHEGAPGGYRTVDHRDITDALGEDYGGEDYSGGMIKFMSEGNIRVSPESGGINLSVAPNKAQRSTLDRYISSFRGEVILDIDRTNGDTIASVEYPKYTHSSVVFKDIDDYFDKGKIPEKFSREPERLNELRRQNETMLAQATNEDAANENERGLIKDYKRQYDKVSGIAEKLNTARQEVLTAERSGDGNTTAKKKIKKHRTHCPVFGRGRRLRPLGLRFWRPPLYQLSYSPIKLVGLQGLEPQTDRL